MGWPGAALLRGKSLANRRAANAGCIAARSEGRVGLISLEASMTRNALDQGLIARQKQIWSVKEISFPCWCCPALSVEVICSGKKRSERETIGTTKRRKVSAAVPHRIEEREEGSGWAQCAMCWARPRSDTPCHAGSGTPCQSASQLLS